MRLSNTNPWSFTHQNLKKKNPRISYGFREKENKMYSTVDERETTARFVIQELHLSNRETQKNSRQKKKKKPPFDAVQKPEAVSPPFVFLDFFQPHLFILYRAITAEERASLR